jgi:hypothetical protein
MKGVAIALLAAGAAFGHDLREDALEKAKALTVMIDATIQ